MHRPELLAPAGSKEALIAAVENGADAVYFGGSMFSARQFASNFPENELEWAIDYAHINGVLAYVAVNTLIKDSELETAGKYLHFLCNAGADAVIIQDIGLLQLLHDHFPALPVHASTQMTVHNEEGVKYLQELGVKRVVLAREMSLDEIRRLKSQTSIEIETFVHGALCFSYSGQCLFSSMVGGRSGNRGQCAQPCRKRYRINGLEGYLLSPKDLNMSGHIGAMIEAGIDSFKIEGRMKRAEYVAGVVRTYRNLINRYNVSPQDFRLKEDEKHILLQLFNRDFTTGYFFGNPGSEFISRKYPHNRGTELGKICYYDKLSRLLSINLKAPLKIGDGIGVGNHETGDIVRNIFIGDEPVTEAASGSLIKIAIEIEASAGDDVFKTFDSSLMKSMEKGTIRKIPVKMYFKALTGKPAFLMIEDGENKVTVNGNIVNRSRTRPLSRMSIIQQLKKLGGTIFEAGEMDIEIDRNIFIPVSEMNALRRHAAEELGKIRIKKWKRECSGPDISLVSRETRFKPILAVNTSSPESLKAAVDAGADIVYIGEEAFGCKGSGLHIFEYAHERGVKVFINTPVIIKKVREVEFPQPPPGIKEATREADGLLVGNLGVLHYVKNNNKPIVIDYQLNIFNRLASDHFLNFAERITVSPELTLKEISDLARNGPVECIVHGFFPLLISEHCLASDLSSSRESREVFLEDEKGFRFRVVTDSNNRTRIMNSRELCMLGYVREILKAGINCLRIEAGLYDAGTTGRITGDYRKAINDAVSGKRSEYRCASGHTTGHYFRGVL